MPSQRVLGLCWIIGSSFLSVSVKYASCILVGFMTVARPAEPARTAPDKSRWLASGRGTSSRRSFMVQSRERGRSVSKGASEFTRVSLCRASWLARERLGPLETSWLFFEEVANL
jgi:hypothetical protein